MDKEDLKALYHIGYGLYVVTCNDGKQDNGLIVNTVMQVTATPLRVAVTINKSNYSYGVIERTGIMNVNCLSVSAPFDVFKKFGFQSGRDVDKFAGETLLRSENGLVRLGKNVNAVLSLKVMQTIDLGTHGMFICDVTEAKKLSDEETMSYTYYQKNVKPMPETKQVKGYVCKICGYVYEGEELPEDFICPWCKHGAADFEPIHKNESKKEDGKMKYICEVCGYVYDEEVGDPDNGIAPGTKFEDLPEDYVCPLCGVGKDQFQAE